jgi:hypothetical protein
MMTLKSDFIDSFVKGVGKTTGIFAVLGMFAGAWYAGQYLASTFSRAPSNKKTSTTTVTPDDDESDILMMRELHHAMNEPMLPAEDGAIKKMLDRYF